MKIAFSLCAASLCVSNTVAFAPVGVPKARVVPAHRSLKSTPENLSLEEEVEQLVQEEILKTKKVSNLRDANGREYAPWMNISENDEAKIRQLVKEKAEARRKRQEQEKDVKGALLVDSQAQELSGVGLRSKVVDGNSVELEWETGSETSTKGFMIKRRAAKQPDFTTLASYEDYGPLVSKGPDGGVYRFLDENVGPGSFLYRVTECETSGSTNDISQCLVEVETAEEQRGAVIALAGFGAVAIAAIAAGFILDPVQY